MWKTEYRCVNCKEVISYKDKMHSLGRCPLCGFKGEGACTIVETTEHGYRTNSSGGRVYLEQVVT